MTWSAEFEYRWQLFLTGLENSNRGLFVLEYDQSTTRDAILKRLDVDFVARGWVILKPEYEDKDKEPKTKEQPIPGQFFVSQHSLTQRIKGALDGLKGKPAKGAIVHLAPDSLESRGLRMLNLERENLYDLPVNIIFLVHSVAYKRLLSEARDLATWLSLPYRFTKEQSDMAQVPSSPKSTSQSRRGLTGELLQTLSATLLRCGPFYSARELNAVFADTRLYPWRYGVPEAGSSKSRVQALIAYLHERVNVDGDNALVLFLRVLRDQTDVNDECYRDLDQLAIFLGGGAAVSIAQSGTVAADIYSQYEMYMNTLLARLGKNHARYNEALIYQQRLSENLEGTRLYGDTETRRAERAEILARLNTLTMATQGALFSDLSGTSTATAAPPTGSITIVGNGNVIGSNNQVSVNKTETPSSGDSSTPANASGLPDRTYVMKLWGILTQYFSLDELNTLCFALGVNYEDLPAVSLSGKARELLNYCERHTCIPKMVAAGKILRPDIDW